MELVAGRSINMAMSVRGREALRGVGCEEQITSKGIEMHSRMLHDTKGSMSAVQYGKVNESILSIDRRYMNEILLSGIIVVVIIKYHKLFHSVFISLRGRKIQKCEYTF
jgi:kynurenine 3-monooxygenase